MGSSSSSLQIWIRVLHVPSTMGCMQGTSVNYGRAVNLSELATSLDKLQGGSKK